MLAFYILYFLHTSRSHFGWVSFSCLPSKNNIPQEDMPAVPVECHSGRSDIRKTSLVCWFLYLVMFWWSCLHDLWVCMCASMRRLREGWPLHYFIIRGRKQRVRDQPERKVARLLSSQSSQWESLPAGNAITFLVFGSLSSLFTTALCFAVAIPSKDPDSYQDRSHKQSLYERIVSRTHIWNIETIPTSCKKNISKV